MAESAGDKTVRATLPLPGNYNRGMFLAFHKRDAEETAERAVRGGIAKGLVWRGLPACLTVTFAKNAAKAALSYEGTAADDAARLEALLARMLGLDQPVAVFEAVHADHGLLGPVLRRGAGLRVPQTATPFEAVCWAVIGQLVSVAAAVSIRRRFIKTANVRHLDGLYCFPGPEHVLRLSEEDLRGAGLSRAKAGAVRNVAVAVAEGKLPLGAWPEMLRAGTVDAATVREALLRVRGIGPWTVSYALLRGLGSLDGSLHGDVAVRRNLARLLGREEKLTEKETEDWLAPFTPWRALVAAHLWNMQKADGY